jgi:hypothetical protein
MYSDGPSSTSRIVEALHPISVIQKVLARTSSPPPSQRHVFSRAYSDGLVSRPSLPLQPSDIRAFTNPRNTPLPDQRPHGAPDPSFVTALVPHDNISTYRPPPTPESSTAPEAVHVKPSLDPQYHDPNPSSVNQDYHNGSVSGGYDSTISPPHPNNQAYHRIPPPGQSSGQPVPYRAPSPYRDQYSGQQFQTLRKQVRATQACNNCRARKQKCDEARPCQFCRENNFDCQYKDVPPPK